VLRLVEPLMADPDRYGAAMDPKTSLQELAARLGLAPPAYVSRPKARSQSRVHRDGERRRRDGDGTGSSKKQAEMAAALTPGARSAIVPELPEVEVVRAGLARPSSARGSIGVDAPSAALTRHDGDGARSSAR
jgi:hypothetical protein